MQCSSGSDVLENTLEFGRKVQTLRIPFSGGIDLTSRCNLRCVHCYLGSARYQSSPERGEIEKNKVIGILDEIRDAGCLDLLITGGEPLLRPDFVDIYAHAKRNGMFVTVFTNGTMISAEIIDTFIDLPPQAVEISLYGATSQTYEAVSRVPGSFRSCINGIERLLEHGIPLRLKTVLLTINRHEFAAIEKMAKAYGVKFRSDAGIFPAFDGDRLPLTLRVPAEEALAKELSIDGHLEHLKEAFRRLGDIKMDGKVYNCNAGLTNFHIGAGGYLTPCLMVRDFKYDLLTGSFLDGWKRMPEFLGRAAAAGNRCFGCKGMPVCGHCPAFFLLENGDENVPSDYLCRIGMGRYSAITDSE